MKLNNPRITFLVGKDQTTIEIEDKDSVIRFIEITLTPEQLSSALSRLAYTPCEVEVYSLDKVGKIREGKTIKFKLPDNIDRYDYDLIRSHAQTLLDTENEGWTVYDSLQSSDNFSFNDDVYTVKCFCVRWIPKEKKDATI